MPFNATGGWVPWTIEPVNSTSGFTGIVSTVTVNIPWFFIFVLALVYVAMLMVTGNMPGRRRYVVITFMGMLSSMVFELFGLVPVAVTGATAGLWIICVFIVVAGGD